MRIKTHNDLFIKVETTSYGCGGGNVHQGPITGAGDCATYEVVRGLWDLQEDEVLLRTASGHYLNVDQSGYFAATATNFEDSTVFKIEKHIPEAPKSTKIALRNHFLDESATYGPKYLKGYNSFVFVSALGAEESNFTLLEYSDGTVMIRSAEGKYLSAVNGGGGDLDAKNPADGLSFDEIFRKEVIFSDSEPGVDRVRFVANNGTHCLSSTEGSGTYL